MNINKCYHCMEDMNKGIKVCPRCGKRSDELHQSEFALQPGTILHGKYLIGTVLGQGGFGITYIGYDLFLDIKVAVKEYYPSNMASRSRTGEVLWSSKATPKEEGCSNFLKEARKMARLMDIPEVVRVLDIFRENDTAYIVMDFVEGITLKEKLKGDGLLPEAEAAALLTPIAEALDEVHKQGIIHRDISPDNIMIDRKGRAKLLDLGAAKEVDMRSSEDRQSSQMIHKDGFSPPEQYTTGGSIGPWTDVYAMSATFYYCVTGRLVPQAVNRLYDNVPVEFTDRISAPVRKVLEKGLSVRTNERYRTMGEFWSNLTKSLKPAAKQNNNAEVRKKAFSGTEQKTRETVKPEAGQHRLTISKKLTAGIVAAVLCIAAVCVSVYAIKRNEASPESNESGESGSPYIKNYEVGDTLFFGTYEQDNNTENGTEPIEWQVLDRQDDKILVISRYALDTQTYNEECETVTWETCTLRTWLNGTFLNSAFGAAEQAQIQSTKVSADKNPDYDTDPGNATTDKVFLLSITEVEKHFMSDEDRKCIPTEYAIANGAFAYNGQCWWWLRSPGLSQRYDSFVDIFGAVYYYGYQVNIYAGCVRPALWITLSEPQNSISTEKNGTALSSSEVGDTISFGTYEQDNNTENGAEPIEWQVLDKQDDLVFIVSRYALDAQPYNTAIESDDVTWETCSLRGWLNETFLNSAFTAEEQAKIESTTVSADKYPQSANPGNATTDKVFLLSITETEKYFSSDEDRMCVPTEYAVAQGGNTYSNYTKDGRATCWWWLRSPGYYPYPSSLINSAGSVFYNGFAVRNDGYCVRPAMWINPGS